MGKDQGIYIYAHDFAVLSRRLEAFESVDCCNSFINPGGGGGAVIRIMAYTGRLCLYGVPFSGFRYMKRYGLLVKVYERVGKSVVLVSKKAQKD